MVSRAVERKKLRKEKKRSRDEGCVVPNVTKPPPKDEDDAYVSSDDEGCPAEVKKGARKAFVDEDDDAAADAERFAPTKKEIVVPTIVSKSVSNKKTAQTEDEEEKDDAPKEAPKAKARRIEKEEAPKKKEASEKKAAVNKKAEAESVQAAEEVPADNAPTSAPASSAPLPESSIIAKLTALDRPLTRKERLKLETAQRNEKQLMRQQRLGERLDAAEAEALQQYKNSLAERKLKKKSADSEGDEDGSADEDGEEKIDAPTLPEIQLRHDERFVGGTYWKERKEKKRKTLFVGNLPMYYDQHITKDYIMDVFAANGVIDREARDAETESKMLDFAAGKITSVDKKSNKNKLKMDKDGGLYGETCPILTIDFLPTKANAKTRHAYIAFRTYELSRKAIELLNGAQPEPNNNNRLRVNCSDDKTQRETAISKRDGKGTKGSGVGAGRGRGGAGRGRGGVAGAGRGAGGGRGGVSRGGGRGRGAAGNSFGGGRGRTFGPGFGFGKPKTDAPAATE